jgi:hypothetical protein
MRTALGALCLLLAALAAAAVAAAAAPVRAAPVVEQMVVFRSGAAITKDVAARQARVRVGRRRCAVGEGTALAALVRSRIGKLALTDYGSCTSRPRDAAGLFVKAIRGQRNRGQNGWVYKVGRRAASAGAADPSGAFGRGRLRRGQRVTWFYCRMQERGCQRTLELDVIAEAGAISATVRGYDDEGRGVPVEGAEVESGSVSGITGADGSVRLSLPPGRHTLVARKDGSVRSFSEAVRVE